MKTKIIQFNLEMVKKIKCVITDIDWDTDGEKVSTLPTNVTFEFEDLDSFDVSDLDVADKLSDKYGYCVNSFHLDKYDENISILTISDRKLLSITK